MHFKIIKTTYGKSTGNCLISREAYKKLPLRFGLKQGCLLSSLLFTIVLEVLGRMVTSKELKEIQIYNDGVKIF